MRNTLNLLILFLLSINCIFAQSKVFDNLKMESEILDMERNYSIYLPPDYETSSRSYPVLYLLHGLGDDHTGWVQFGEVKKIADESIINGDATPMIIVMPDANTGYVGYINIPSENWLYRDRMIRIKSKKTFMRFELFYILNLIVNTLKKTTF